MPPLIHHYIELEGLKNFQMGKSMIFMELCIFLELLQ